MGSRWDDLRLAPTRAEQDRYRNRVRPRVWHLVDLWRPQVSALAEALAPRAASNEDGVAGMSAEEAMAIIASVRRTVQLVAPWPLRPSEEQAGAARAYWVDFEAARAARAAGVPLQRAQNA